LATQAKLLRVIENRQVLRVGGLQPTHIDVRFVAATNRDLEADVETGRFRQDLFFRLNGLVIGLPPLRERRADVAPLARAFAAQASRSMLRTPPPDIAPDALAMLEAH